MANPGARFPPGEPKVQGFWTEQPPEACVAASAKKLVEASCMELGVVSDLNHWGATLLKERPAKRLFGVGRPVYRHVGNFLGWEGPFTVMLATFFGVGRPVYRHVGNFLGWEGPAFPSWHLNGPSTTTSESPQPFSHARQGAHAPVSLGKGGLRNRGKRLFVGIYGGITSSVEFPRCEMDFATIHSTTHLALNHASFCRVNPS